jgi:uncharacterized damage-inducible protein DinB
MIDVEAIQELYRYNRWANDRVFDVVSSLTHDEFARNLGSSYPSVRDTLAHLVWAEWIWLQRWNGTSPQIVSQGTSFPSPGALRARWLELDVEQRAFVQALTTGRLVSPVEYVNLQGHTWRYPLWRQMYHVVNHSSYHRGQVTTMLRQLAAQPVSTDFLVFHDELDSQAARGAV